jgi:tetratricopeptide (TPR) repeat protein
MAELVSEEAKSAVPAVEDPIATANALKDEGNKLLTSAKFALAAEKYTEALRYHQNAIYYSNRSQALIKLESYGEAISDANEALK